MASALMTCQATMCGEVSLASPRRSICSRALPFTQAGLARLLGRMTRVLNASHWLSVPPFRDSVHSHARKLWNSTH